VSLADALLEGLNPEQQEAVRTTEGPLLVLAGAGSGKTRVLTNRVAWLIGVCGIAPEAILAVTFTNKAAGEMRDRVIKLLGPDARGVWLSTFHSSCVRILRSEIGHLGRSRGFVIYDEDDSLSVVREALRRHGHDPKEEARRLRWRIDQWKNAGLLPAAAAERAEDLESEEAAEVYATYQRLLAEANALDFGDLLLLTVELMERFPNVLRHYQERWQYVLVDEYQDTNRVQYKLVNLLAAAHRNLCVVGDPNQSIYRWRGADVRNILDFERDFPDAKVVTLHRNYRSTQRILSGAGAVVENNPGRPPKRMITDRGDGERIVVYSARDDRDEAQFVVRGILEAVRGHGRSYGQCAVFYRTNAQSRPIEEELLKYDVPYVVVGGVRFYERAEVKDALSYLRLVVNPADGAAARRIVNRPPRGIGKSTLERADALAEERGIALFEALRAFGNEETGRAGTAVRGFVALMDSLAAELEHALPADGIARVLERTGYVRALEAEGTPEAEARLENLRELVVGAEDFAAANAGESDGRSPLEQFLDQVALVSDLDAAEMRHDRVSLMTVHSAKGLEFPVVYVAGLEEGVLPHQASSQDPRAVEEERRLCYVAMTRAMEQLTLTWAQERRRYGSRSFGIPSRFLAEIPAGLVEKLGVPEWEAREARDDRPAYDYSYDQSRTSRGSTSSAGDESGVARGMRVRHPIFGVGTVLEVIGSGPGQALRIRFDRAGVKKIIVRYANLELG
jgi:DNA helicase-2/ATP-dependent DNA helicase PcrA